MQIIISPAKTMKVDPDSFPVQGIPPFPEETAQLLSRLQEMTYEELKALWKCSDALAELNAQRFRDMDLKRCLTPAILSYEGIQYQYMAPGIFTAEALEYVQKHLRILSGFYGIVRPFDGVVPYRLEMQAKLAIGGKKDLYGFWGGKLADYLMQESDCILNLASKEYSLSVSRHLPPSARMITCVCGERQNGKVVEKGTMCKMARGEMVRWLSHHGTETPEDAKRFDGLDYRFSAADSDETKFVFIKEEK